MTKHISKLAGGMVALLTMATMARADIKLNDNITLSGYAVGAYMNYKATGVPGVDSLFDASKPIPGGGDSNDVLTKFTINYKPVTTVISFNYFPNLSSGEFTVLDAYATYDAGNGLSFTGGKFLSYLGYESFYPNAMDQISYADNDFLGAIPGYHSGLKLDYTHGTSSIGLAVLDSVYSPFGGTRGDGELAKNAGFEGYYSYTGVKNLTLWAGFAYDTKGGFEAHSVTTLDFWAAYKISKDLRVAAEYAKKDGGVGAKGSNWLAFVDYASSDKVSTAFRISGEDMSDGGPGFTKYTICPGYALTANLTLRAEYSYYDYKDFSSTKANFFGVQAVFTF
jgi:hypothetical protein